MNKILLALILLTQPLTAFAQFKYQELIHVRWGDKRGNVGFRTGPGGQFGPNSFSVNGDTVIILDSPHRHLKFFHQRQYVKSIDLPSDAADDFIYHTDDDYLLLADNKVLHVVNEKATVIFQTSSPRDKIQSLRSLDSNMAVAALNNGNSIEIEATAANSLNKLNGIPVAGNRIVTVTKLNWKQANIRIDNSSFSINSARPNLGTVRFIGQTPQNEYFIYIEQIEQQVPLRVRRDIRLYSIDGSLKATFHIPTHAHTYIFKEFYVDTSGNLFHLISAKDGIHVIGWYRTTADFQNVPQFDYPDKFNQYYHYNDIEQPEAEPDWHRQQKSEKEKSLNQSMQAVTRSEALAIGDTYVQHVWTAGAQNLTNGLIRAPDGLYIRTPTWINIGSNIKIPYKWGGFSTLESFDIGLQQGKFTGDNYTSKSSGSSYCVGVDCSGFVSRCWKLSAHYSTRMMDDYIAQLHSSWFDLRPADAIHKPGHVRLFVDFNPDGSLLAVESTGKSAINFWRVGYFSYTLSDLSGYSPRYYIHIEGMPATLPKPELVAVTFDDQTAVSWQFADADQIDGFNIYRSQSESNWERINQDDLIPLADNSKTLTLVNNSPQFFKMTGVNNDESTVESNPSDAYGYYNSGSPGKILVVDGFDRISHNGSYPFPYHTFAARLGLAVAGYGYSFETASNEAVIDGNVNLTDYAAVFWLLGDESTDDKTFDASEQHIVQSYLKQGGNLFVSGSEIAWDLDYRGNASDKAFIHDYLKVSYDVDDAGNYTVNGVANSDFSGLTLHYDNGDHGVYQEDYPDVYKTIGGSVAVLRYGNDLIAGTTFQGVVPGGSDPAKIFVMGFPFETIYLSAERTALMGKILDFFDLSPTPIAEQPIEQPAQFVLEQNYPNPFNPSTHIRYSLPVSSHVALTIFTISGQHVRHLVNEHQTEGSQQILWDGTTDDGTPAASGIYFYQLRTEHLLDIKKMILLR